MRVLASALFAAALIAASAFGEERAPAFPFEHQDEDFCGEACFAMALQHWGLEVNQYRVHSLTGLAPVEGRGGYTREMYAAAKAIWGESFPSPWYEWQGKDDEEQKRFQQLAEWVKTGTPCMVCCRYDESPGTTEHFRLVTGIDADSGAVSYQEPAEADGAGRTMSRERFLKLWPVAGGPHGLLIAFPLSRPPEPAKQVLSAASELSGRITQTVRRMRKRLPGHFLLAVEGPYVIASDQTPEEFKTSREHTIRWAYTHLQAQFFPGGLSRPLEVYLFDGKESYEKHTREFFSDTPTTPYGYFSSQHNALIMNIATGGGTLVHEMVHPLMAEHFPGVPSWFNEGLASLFEQCGEEDGRMVGLINWRYKGLREAIRTGAFTSLEKLMKSTTAEFYANDQGDNYGIARYLCQYLQSLGKIEEYYKRFREHAGEDPDGIASLEAVLGEKSLAKIQETWLAWVKGLR